MSGHLAVVIPIGKTWDGLPIGLQIVGKRWLDMELLAIAQELDGAAISNIHPAFNKIM